MRVAAGAERGRGYPSSGRDDSPLVVLVSFAHEGYWAVVAGLLPKGRYDAACGVGLFQ